MPTRTHVTSKGSYHLEYWPKPIPDRRHDWDWWHDDYDGAPDAHDHRAGSAETPEACISIVEEMESDD